MDVLVGERARTAEVKHRAINCRHVKDVATEGAKEEEVEDVCGCVSWVDKNNESSCSINASFSRLLLLLLLLVLVL